MNNERERRLVEIIRVAGWTTVWDLWQASPIDSTDTIRKTLRILEAAGLVECRQVNENHPEHQWRWIPDPCIAPSDELP